MKISVFGYFSKEKNHLVGGSTARIPQPNKVVSWGDFCKILKDPVVQSFTDPYVIDKEVYNTAKDVGAFIAGDAEASNTSGVKTRSAFCYDIDDDNIDNINIKDLLDMLYPDTLYVIYGTLKHIDGTWNRLRIVIPFSGEMEARYYESSARSFAKELGIYDIVDSTTFQANRKMYLPSIAKGSKYLYHAKLQGNPLEVDKITVKGVIDLIDPKPEQKDPKLYSGIRGAFNRVYDIHSAISEFLPDIFINRNFDRYTYYKATSANGAVVYGNNRLYDNHDTDPYNGRALDAYGLVRAHKFNDDDNLMLNFCKSLASVSAEYTLAQQENVINNAELFKRGFNYEDITNCLIKKVDSKGNEVVDTKSPSNYRLILENWEPLKGAFRFNELSKKVELTKDLSLLNCRKIDPTELVPLLETDITDIRTEVSNWFPGFTVQDEYQKQIYAIAQRNLYNPVKEYFDTLKYGVWDGVKRAETVFIDYLEADDTPLMRRYTIKVLAAIVNRVYTPGKKFDIMTIFTGKTGVGKSTLLNVLALGNKPWSGGKLFNDNPSMDDKKSMVESLLGRIIVEFQEVDVELNTKKSSKEMKQFITTQSDVVRLSYRQDQEDIPRTCVLFGTANSMLFLSDPTSSRRFFVIEVKKTDRNIDKILAMPVDQIYAEILERYMDEPLYLTNDDALLVEDLNKKYTSYSPILDEVDAYINTKIPQNWDFLTAESRRQYYLDRTTQELLVELTQFTLQDFICSYLGETYSKYSLKQKNDIIEYITNKKGFIKARIVDGVRGSIDGFKKIEKEDDLPF